MASTQMVPYQGSGSDYFPQPRRIGSAQRAQLKQQRRAAKKAAKPVFRSAATGYLTAKSVSFISRQAFNEDGSLTTSAESWLTRAVTVQRPVAMANLRRMRKSHPTLSNRQLAAQLDKEFKRSMTGGGALIGATSAVPGVGTVTSLGLSTLATGSFLELCAIYAQSMAELSGVSTEDPQKAKLLVMGVMLGDEGRRLLAELSAQADGRGVGPVGSIVPLSNLASSAGTATTMAGIVSAQLKRQFVRRFFIRQDTSMFSRAIPFGIGAVVGGIGNRALAQQIVRNAHKTFGELPEETPEAVVEDFKRGLQREKLRADRKERRAKKKELKASAKAKRAARKQLQS